MTDTAHPLLAFRAKIIMSQPLARKIDSFGPLFVRDGGLAHKPIIPA